MKSIFIALLSLTLIASGCSSDSHDDYVGVWHSDGKPLRTYEISKDGKNYFFQNLRGTNLSGDKDGPMPLSTKEDRLVLSFGFGELPLVLSPDKDRLAFEKHSLNRVRDGQLMKQEIENEFAQRKANRAQCQALGKEMKEREKANYATTRPPTSRLADAASLKNEMEQRASAIPDCNAALLLY